MTATLVATVNCPRGVLTQVLASALSANIYSVENGAWLSTTVKYWGSAYVEINDSTNLAYPYYIYATQQMYRRANRIAVPTLSGTVSGRLTVWVPNEYAFPSLTATVYRLT